MTDKPLTVPERLDAARLAIANTLAHDEIQSLVAGFGYKADQLQKGKALLDEAEAASQMQIQAVAGQHETTREAHAAELDARDAYQALAKVARAIFKSDHPRAEALGLTGSEPKSTAAFSAGALALFRNAEGAAGLADFGYDSAKLSEQRALIDAYVLAEQKQEAAKSAAQRATEKRDAVVERLDAWRAQFLKIARVALRGDKQLLEQLGVAARSGRTDAQRAASKRLRTKAAASKKPASVAE